MPETKPTLGDVMRLCRDCGVLFPITKRRNPMCLVCRRVYDKNWRKRRKAEGRPVVSRKMPSSYHVAYKAKYYQQPEAKKRRAEHMREYVKLPYVQPKVMARMATRNAIRRGDLIQQPCEVCGALRSEAHHEDYSRPLDVRWLCRLHHEQHHLCEKAESR